MYPIYGKLQLHRFSPPTNQEFAMTTLIVLFNLKHPAASTEYERWAREVDLPTAGSLPSVERFEVLKAQGVFGGGTSPYQYVEILRVKDMAQFGVDVVSATMQKVAAQFQTFADMPIFMVTEPL
jgi:hypothetical protein